MKTVQLLRTLPKRPIFCHEIPPPPFIFPQIIYSHDRIICSNSISDIPEVFLNMFLGFLEDNKVKVRLTIRVFESPYLVLGTDNMLTVHKFLFTVDNNFVSL